MSSPIPISRAASGLRKKFSPILTVTSSCKRPASSPLRAGWRITVCMCCCLRIWPITEWETQDGRATTKASRCFSPSAKIARWPWLAPHPGGAGRWALSDFRTDGRTSQTFSDEVGIHARGERQHCLDGEIDLAACGGEFVLASGSAAVWAEAGQVARSSLQEPYEELRKQYVWHWRNWQDNLLKLDQPQREMDLYRASAAVLRLHESKDFLGGVIASLSIPWGFNKGDEDLGGYHLVWPRDLVETAADFWRRAPRRMRCAC